MTCRSFRSSLLCGLLLALSCAASPSPARPRWDPGEMQMALEQLRPQERRSFFDSMRRWEDRRHRAQRTFLERSERCLAETSFDQRRWSRYARRAAADRCSERLLVDHERIRQNLRQERLAIHRRHGLPVPRGVAFVADGPSRTSSSPLGWLETLLLGSGF